MATLDVIKYKAAAELSRTPYRDDVLVWFMEQLAALRNKSSKRARDVRVPYELGDLHAVVAMLDEGNRPCYVVEDYSRTVSIAASYADLFYHEAER